MSTKQFAQSISGPALAVDNVLLTIKDKELSVLLLEIGSGPYTKYFALPGGLVQMGEDLGSAAKRVISSKTGLNDIYIEQLKSFGKPDRDSRGHVVSVAYFSIIADITKLKLSFPDHYRSLSWFPVKSLPSLAFDHLEIIKEAEARVASKLNYSNIASKFLQKEFTLSDLQTVYEIVQDKKQDKRNFRKKVDTLDIIEETGRVQTGTAFRPAKIYQFKSNKLQYFK